MMAGTNPTPPTRFGFLLLNEFTLISMSSAIEPLRMANRICQRDHYAWKIISETGDAVAASNGLSVDVDCGIASPHVFGDLDTIIVCGGEHVERNTSKAVLQWLKEAARRDLALGAICTGSQVLAEAGLLNGSRCSIHWENMTALTNLYPQVIVCRSVFCIDRGRYTCSGGTAPLDMMLHFITAQRGGHVSAGVAEQFICERIRRPDDRQRVPLKNVIGQQSGKLVAAAELMEANIREPIAQEDLAAYVGLSSRQLQRLFHRYVLCTPSHYYLQLRLQRGRELLFQTHMSLAEIAELTGFVTSPHFSKSYKKFYGISPSVARQPLARAAGRYLV